MTTITIERDLLEQAQKAGFTLQRDERLFSNMLARFATLVASHEREAWTAALKDAFFEGFTSVATYNDTLLNSPEEAWENYKPPRAAPPQRTMVPLTEEEIFKIENDIPDDVISDRAWTICLTRAVEKAVWEKNHGQA